MEKLFFDAHCHPDDAMFDPDRDAVLSALPARGIRGMIAAGTNLHSSRLAAQYAAQYPYIYYAAGFYPHETEAMDDQALCGIRQLLADEKCVAVGEIGLDYHYDGAPREIQLEALERQLLLAEELRLPVVLHERDALEDMLFILKQFRGRVQGMMHCFSGSMETAKILLDLGYDLSFTGSLTFKNARYAPEVVRYAPRSRILSETDSPYMTPVPYRGERNTPANVALVTARIAEIWGIPVEEAAQIVFENAQRLFGVKDTQ